MPDLLLLRCARVGCDLHATSTRLVPPMSLLLSDLEKMPAAKAFVQECLVWH
jgi:hypothetical protein